MEGQGIIPTMPIGNNGFGFGGDGIWALLIFALIFNGGIGGNRYPQDVATTSYVSSEFTQRDIADVNNNLYNGFQNSNNLISTGFAGVSNQVLENKYAGQLAACQTQRDVLTQTNELNTNLLTTALQAQAKMDECCCTIRSQGIENTQKILDAMNQNTINSLRSQVNDLKNTITAQNIGSTIINAVRPYPVPSWTVSSPYVSVEPTA